MTDFDLLIAGGTVIDPASGLHDGPRHRDRRRPDRRRGARTSRRRPPTDVLDATDRLVVPGLVDLHVHVYWGVADLSVEADPTCLGRGVTTVVDAGSAGANTFPGFRRSVVEASRRPGPGLPQHQRHGPDRSVPRASCTTCASPTRSERAAVALANPDLDRRLQGPRLGDARRPQRPGGPGSGARGRAGDEPAGHGPHRRHTLRHRGGPGPAPSGRRRHPRLHRLAPGRDRHLRWARRRGGPRGAGRAASDSTWVTAPAASPGRSPRPRWPTAFGRTRSAPTSTASTSRAPVHDLATDAVQVPPAGSVAGRGDRDGDGGAGCGARPGRRRSARSRSVRRRTSRVLRLEQGPVRADRLRRHDPRSAPASCSGRRDSRWPPSTDRAVDHRTACRDQPWLIASKRPEAAPR